MRAVEKDHLIPPRPALERVVPVPHSDARTSPSPSKPSGVTCSDWAITMVRMPTLRPSNTNDG